MLNQINPYLFYSTFLIPYLHIVLRTFIPPEHRENPCLVPEKKKSLVPESIKNQPTLD